MVKYQEFIPHPVLQDCVKRFWIMERAYTAETCIEEVVPDACVELILNFGSPYVQLGNTPRRELPKVCLVGLQSQPILVQASGVVKIVAVRFFAWGVLPFLKPLAEPNSTTNVELDEAWGHVVAKVAAKVETEKYQQAVEELEAFLIGKRLTTWFDPGQVREAAKRLYETKGQVQVAHLADSCSLSVRQLQRQFAETTGVSPKTLARTIRFETIRNRLMFEPEANLTDLAYECGYTDQAHFIHDFKAFAQKTPGEFAQQMHMFQALLRQNEHVVFLQSPSSMLDYTEKNSPLSKKGRRYYEMKKSKMTCGLLVKDYDEALDFYTKKLGFVVVEDVPMGEDRWVTITLPGNQDAVLALHEAHSEDDLALIGKQCGSFPLLGIATDDCMGEYQRMKALGITFHGEPAVSPYGTGVMFEDLYGNKLFLNQEPGD